MGLYASLVVQQLYGRLVLADSLQKTAWVFLAVIPPMDKVLYFLGTLSSVVSYLLSTGGRHMAAIAELFCLIEILDYLHTKFRGVITSLHLTKTLMFDLS